MGVDLAAARAFVDERARPIDRLRLRLAVGEAVEPGLVIAELNRYALAGGGYGHGLEPDPRAPEAHPVAAMHAFEVFDEIAPATDARAAALCGWLAGVMLPDGGLPSAPPVASSLEITAAVAGAAHRVARSDPGVATHPWLMMATGFCLGRMEGTSGPMPARELLFSLRLLAAMEPQFPRAAAQLDRIGSQIPRSGRVPVAGGADDEFVRPLDLAPFPGDAVRAFVAPARIDEDLERLVAGQGADGAWSPDRAGHHPDDDDERRGYLTVRAVRLLRGNGILA